MYAWNNKSARWAGGAVLGMVAGLALASACKPAEPVAGPQVGAPQVLAPAAAAPAGPAGAAGPVAAAPGQPAAAAALPAAPSAVAAPVAAAPVELVAGKPPFEMPDWYAPLFVVGNRWRYSSQVSATVEVFNSLEEGGSEPAEQTSNHTTECRAAKVALVGQEAVTTIECVSSGKVGTLLTWTYLAGPKGLYRDPTVRKGVIGERGTVVLKNPIAPFRVAVDSDGTFAVTMSMKWGRAAVPTKGQVQLAECSHHIPFGGEAHYNVSLAQGVGIVSVDTAVGSELPSSENHTLQEFIPAMVPATPVPGQLSLSSEGERLAKAGLRCADQIGVALAAGEPGQPVRISPGGWADVSSDVRPGVAALRGKVGKCSLTIETRNSNVTRLGSFWTGKPGDLAAVQAQLGAPLERVELTQGSTATAWKVSEGILVVYQPTTRKPEYEWWVYDAAQWTDAERAVWRAYAFNDAAMELADSKDPLQLAQAAVGLREATKLVPTYSKAWLRLCKVAQKIGKPTKDFVEAKAACGKAQLSAFGDVRKEAGKLLKGMGPG